MPPPPPTKFTVYKRGWFLIQRIANFILCDIYLVASRLCMGKAHLKIRYHKRGLGLEKDCVTNMVMNMASCVMNIKGVPCLRHLWGQGIS